MLKETQHDAVFREEQNHLAETEKTLHKLLNNRQKKVHAGEEEFSSSRYNDKEDLLSLGMVRHDINRNSLHVTFFEKVIPQPYFGRVDVVEDGDNNETETYYVGNDEVHDDDANVVVVSWKSPVGSIFYAGTQTIVDINDTSFQLLLRRALEIQNEQLLSYHTEYDAESSESLNGEIVDSFLLKVLKDKRREKRLTNIIRTIQANQNKIIRKPQGENLVVQGCAGSGKTMILLHRLSVLAYNNRNWDLSRVKIITPNHAFNMHINALSKELGLEDIERCSVEEYYASLAHKFNKSVEIGAEIHSEILLNQSFLKEVYSLDFMNKICSDYETYWKTVVQELQGKNFAELCNICGIESVSLDTHKNSTVEMLKGAIQRAQEKAEQQTQIAQDLQKRIEEIENRLHARKNSIASLDAILTERRSLADKALESRIQKLDTEIELQKNQPIENEKVQAFRREIAQIRQLRDKVEKSQREIDANTAQYIDYEQVHKLSDYLSAQIIDHNQKIETDIQSAEAELKHTPFYNFAKRNGLKEKISQLKQSFTLQAQAYIEAYKSTRAEAIQKADIKQAELEKKLAIELQYAGENRKIVAALQHSKDVLQMQRKALSLPSYSAWHGAVGSTCEEVTVKDYDKVLSEYAAAEKSVVSLQELLAIRQAELKESEAHILSETQCQDLVFCADIVKQLEWQSVINNVLNKDLAELHIKNGVSRRVTNYRFKLYLRLLCCMLYYRPLAKPDNFLCIDEAQDISVAEYHLLRAVLGKNCVLNLYGDVNQNIYSYKGITTWEDISDITGIHDIMDEADMTLEDTTHVCLLNENYRNTLQITEFCNKEFGAPITAVGIAGEPVQELSLNAAVEWLWKLKCENSKLRVAVVYKPGSKDFHTQMDTLPQTTDVSWDVVDTDKLCILPVELVKGLEFDAVVAVVDRMSYNEKYVTFTRALDYLSVVRDSFRADEADSDNTDKKSNIAPVPAKIEAVQSAQESVIAELASSLTSGVEPIISEPDIAQPEHTLESASPEETPVESAMTITFYAWLANQVPQDQLQQMQEMYHIVDEFCTRTSLLTCPVTELRDDRLIQRAKSRVRSSRSFLIANRMRMPLIFKALDLLAAYAKLVVKQQSQQTSAAVTVEAEKDTEYENPSATTTAVLPEQIPAQKEPVQPEEVDTTKASLASGSTAEKEENELLTLFPQEKLQPLLQVMARDGITTKKQFAQAMVVGYINQCDYGARRRIIIWEAVKPVWAAWRRGDNGEPELAGVSAALEKETVSGFTAVNETRPTAGIAPDSYATQPESSHITARTQEQHTVSTVTLQHTQNKEAISIGLLNSVQTPVMQAAAGQSTSGYHQELPDRTKSEIASYIKKCDLAGANLTELADFMHLSREGLAQYLDTDTDYIEITRDVYLHRDSIFDIDDVAEPLENILQKQFRHFYGFTTDKKLKEGADQELSMFMNDYDFHTKEEIYGIAKYLFGKCKVNGIEHGFNGNGYIWEKPTKMESNRMSILINLARRYSEPVLTRDEIVTQFELLGFFVAMYKQAMDLGPTSPFLQYDMDKFVLAERMKMNTAWAIQIGDALDRLMDAAQNDYVILRAIQQDWYDANLPILPEGVRWTPLLLQEVVEHYLQGRYRTVHQYSGLASDTLCAAIVKEKASLVTFPDIVYNYFEHCALAKADFTCEEFRQKLVQAGMLQGAELRTTLPKALDDHRFAWDTAKENLHIVGV